MSSDLHQYYLQQMGIETWVLRDTRVSLSAIKGLEKTISTCMRCPLHLTRTQTVFARGNPNAKLMIIGDAPSYHDDQHGVPFSGRAGILLHQMLSSIGLTEEDVYFTHATKCCPSDKRSPHSEEMDQCNDYLNQQIALISPKLIFAVGQLAGQFLIKSDASLDKMQSTLYHYAGIPVLVSFHPNDLLKNPSDKKRAYEDLMRVKQFLSG